MYMRAEEVQDLREEAEERVLPPRLLIIVIIDIISINNISLCIIILLE